MSVAGLRRRPQYEEVLNAAHKDLASHHGVLGVGLQNFATRAVNNPLFQRVQANIEEKMKGDQRQLLEERGFQNDVQAMAVDQEVSHHDLSWIVQNIQRPQPVPVPSPQPAPQVDYLRVAAEMDLLAQRRATQAAHQQVADQASQQMSALAVATPAQRLVRNHHALTQPLPPPDSPPPAIVDQARSAEQSVQTLHAAAQAPTRTRQRTAGSTRTRSTPYGASSSLAVPAGGFLASSSTPAPRAAAPAPRAATAPAQTMPDTSSAADWSIYAARPSSAQLYAPSQTARASVLSANVQAAARRHLLDMARRHAQPSTAPALLRRTGQAGKRKDRAPATTSVLRRPPDAEERPKSKRNTGALLDRSRYAQTYNLDAPGP